MNANKGSTVMKTFATRLLAFLVAVTLMSWVPSVWAVTPEATVDVVRQALKERTAKGASDKAIQEIAFTRMQIRSIVRKNLDGRLLVGMQNASGADFYFAFPKQDKDVQVAVLALQYPDDKAANTGTKKLEKAGGVFKNSKILTPFAYTQTGNCIAIVFTEKAGNKDVVKLVGDLAERLKASPTR